MSRINDLAKDFLAQQRIAVAGENGIEVSPGSCPMQFLGEDFGHTCMRGF